MLGAARDAAAEQGEGAVVVHELCQVHGSSSVDDVDDVDDAGGVDDVSAGDAGEERTPETPKAAPRAAFAKSVVRAISGPPEKRSTTSSGSKARTCREPYRTHRPSIGRSPRLTFRAEGKNIGHDPVMFTR
ncbi:hypothetical protein ACE1SV_17720 [Streptomyces sp. E-15]